MGSELDPEGSLTQYYSKLGREIQFSRARRDTVTNWGLTLFLAIVAAYAASLTTQASLPAFWRIGIIAAGLALSVRFFVQGMIAYAFLRKWGLLQLRIESHWMPGKEPRPSIDDIIVDVETYDRGSKVPVRWRDMLWSQIRAGFVLIFSVLFILLIVEALRPGALTWEAQTILGGFFIYLLWESYTFVTYDQLKKPPPLVSSSH